MLDGVRDQFPNRTQGGEPSAETEMDHSNAAHELRRLLEVLHGTRQDLSEELMLRAARITGTSLHFARIISRVEVAIRTAQKLLAEHDRPGSQNFDAVPENSLSSKVGTPSNHREPPYDR
jgi:hypothetical protein